MRICLSALLALTILSLTSPCSAAVQTLPQVVRLSGADSQQQLVVGTQADGRNIDLTRDATYESANANIAAVSSEGVITPVGNGVTEIRVRSEHGEAVISVTVSDAGQSPALDFENDIIPILTDGGCNS